MTNQPERSVEEIVEELKIMLREAEIVTDYTGDVFIENLEEDKYTDWLTQTLQAERQKREEAEPFICTRKGIHTCRVGAVHIPENFCGKLSTLTHPNNK